MISLNIKTELTARVAIITFMYSIISYIVIQKDVATPDQLAIAVPLLFVTFGVVILISILFCLWRYHVMNIKR